MLSRLLSVIIGLIFAYQYANGAIPIVLWHGMGDSCCNPFSMGSIKRVLEREIPGVYVLSLEIGKSIREDIESGFFMNINSQINQVCQQLANDQNLKNGYNAIGFSQGGLFMRGLAQRCPHPGIKHLISLGGPQQGVYGFPRCPASNEICEIVRRLLDYGAYESFVQNTLVQAEYWHDPLNEEKYQNKSIFLANINNERLQNDTYKMNLLKLEKLVLVKFLKDTMVMPPESEWFGFYKPGQDKIIQAYNQTDLYIQDRLGLKHMERDGKLDFLMVDADHLRFTEQWFITEIINKYLK